MEPLIDLLAVHGVGVVFVVTLLARIGAPLPASPLLVVAGGLAADGAMSLPALLAVSVAANVLGDAAWFAAGRRYGARVLTLLCRVSLSRDTCVRQSEALIARWGGSSLVAAKFVPGVSVVAAPMAGAVGMSTLRFVAWDLLGGAVWSVVFLGLGVAFSREIQRLLDAMARAGGWAALLLGLALAAFVGWRYLRRRQTRAAAAVPRIDAGALQALVDAGEAPVVIDVRSAAAVALDPRQFPGAIRLDLTEIAHHALHLPHDRELVLYCNCPEEASAALAATVLHRAGRPRARPLAGGLDGWAAAGRPLVRAPGVTGPVPAAVNDTVNDAVNAAVTAAIDLPPAPGARPG